jgi:hypothetical protein
MLGTPVDLHAGNPHLKYYNETLFFQARACGVAALSRVVACACVFARICVLACTR